MDADTGRLSSSAYFKYGGILYAMTATEAAVYNKQAGNDLRSKMLSLTHKNLPLSMFLETADLGFPAWGGPTTEVQPGSFPRGRNTPGLPQCWQL